MEGIANLMVTFGGAVSYSELKGLPLPELFGLHREARRIHKDQEAARSRASGRRR
jgi:hypothetical protein